MMMGLMMMKLMVAVVCALTESGVSCDDAVARLLLRLHKVYDADDDNALLRLNVCFWLPHCMPLATKSNSTQS